MFEHKVGIQHNLSSADRWTDREGQQDTRGYVEDVGDASTMKVGRVSPFGRVPVQQQLSGIIEDESV